MDDSFDECYLVKQQVKTAACWPDASAQVGARPLRGGASVTCVYVLQAVAAEVELLEVFGQQELLGPESSDVVPGQIHLHDVRRQLRRDVVQICREARTWLFRKEGAGKRECERKNKDVVLNMCHTTQQMRFIGGFLLIRLQDVRDT